MLFLCLGKCGRVAAPADSCCPFHARQVKSQSWAGLRHGTQPIHSEETPSVTFSLLALLRVKTIKANSIQMFECTLPISGGLTNIRTSLGHLIAGKVTWI